MPEGSVPSCHRIGSIRFLRRKVATQFDVIAGDGTAFWGLAFMPVVLIWLPLTAVGMLTGAGVVTVLRVKKANEPR